MHLLRRMHGRDEDELSELWRRAGQTPAPESSGNRERVMRKIAFATCERLPDLTEDDRLMIGPLRRHSIEVSPLVWDSGDAQGPGSIVIRSCWDYHYKPQQFLRWIRQTVGQGTTLWNPARVVGWNLNKAYLRDLKRQGVATPETVWLERGARARLRTVIEEQGWQKGVVKPLISATAFRTWVTSPETAKSEQGDFDEVLSESGAMVQRFVDEVQTRGEWSFMFFGGEYSHAVLKRPKAGDFRVQEEYGGYAESVKPAPPLIEQARGIIELVPGRLLFARV